MLRVAVPPVPFFNVFKWQFENTTIFNSPRRAANGRPYGGCRREAAGVEAPPPYGAKLPDLSLRDQSADWSWQSVTPVPFSMFSNGNLKTPPFSIFNSQFSIRPFGVRRALDKRPYGGDGARRVRGTADG